MKCKQPELLQSLLRELFADPEFMNIELMRVPVSGIRLQCSRCGEDIERKQWRGYNTCIKCQKELMMERAKARRALKNETCSLGTL